MLGGGRTWEVTMPLSENEQRLLEQMEQALYAEDPKFASQLRGSDARTFYRKRLVLAGCGFALGVVALMGGAVATVYPVAIVGFLLMLASAWYGVTAWRRIPAPGEIGSFPASAKTAGKKKGRGSGGFVSRAEERWRKRRDEMGR
jgi:hypothetical protein